MKQWLVPSSNPKHQLYPISKTPHERHGNAARSPPAVRLKYSDLFRALKLVFDLPPAYPLFLFLYTCRAGQSWKNTLGNPLYSESYALGSCV